MVRNQANQIEKTNTCSDYNRVDEPKMIINIIEDTKNSETASIMFLVKNTFRGSITNNIYMKYCIYPNKAVHPFNLQNCTTTIFTKKKHCIFFLYKKL